MGDDISSGSICYCFLRKLYSAAQFVFKGQKMTLKDNLSLNPDRFHYPLITNLSSMAYLFLHLVVADDLIANWTA